MKYKIALITLAVLLLALFTFTTLFFTRSAEKLDKLAGDAMQNAEVKDVKATEQSLKKLREEFDSEKWKFKLLLDHEEVDKLEIALEKAERSTALKEESETLYALDELRSIANYIGQIELPLLTNIF